MRKISTLFLVMLLIIPAVPAYAVTDSYILADPAYALYTGAENSHDMQENLRFNDMGEYYWLNEAVVRNGALGIIKGQAGSFSPEETVSKQEAVAYIMNALGYEKAALAQAGAVTIQLPLEVSNETAIYLAYLYFASGIGVISKQDYTDAMDEEVFRAEGLSLPEGSFFKNLPATREEVAYWLYMGLQTVDKSLWESPLSVQTIYTFSDWQDIEPGMLMAVEAVARNNILTGYEGAFLPKETLSRAVMAQALGNMDSIYLGMTGVVKKTGTVGAITEETRVDTSEYAYARQILVRNSEGLKEIIQFDASSSTSPQAKTRDAVVFKDYGVTGLMSIEEGDVLEYLVDPLTNTVLYVNVLGEGTEFAVQGALESVDVPARSITIRQDDGIPHTYTFAEGMGIFDYGIYYLVMDLQRVDVKLLPFGSRIELSFYGGIVTSASYIGDPVIVTESAGIVIENDPAFGYLTVLDSNGNILTKRYYENDLTVEKRNHYDVSQSIGYISQVFPNFKFNPRQSTIAEIEPGDIIYFRTFDDDTDVIESISAATNYTVKYGKVRQVKQFAKYAELLIEYENGRTAWFSVAGGVYTSKDGRVSSIPAIKAGDWVKLLVNEAVLAPGHIMETVKEISIEGPEHYISEIIKGSLAGFNQVQNQLLVENAQVLSKTGWSSYKNLASFSLSGSDIEYYENGTRVSQDYAVKYFTRSEATVYIGIENSYTGPRVKMVSFRTGRDEIIAPDTVTAASGGGDFDVLSLPGSVPTDAGTIVVRHGRLVSGKDIMAADFVRVVLNGGAAAVVDISDAPDVSGLMLARGRVMSVDDGVSFKVQSMGILNGTSWIYTPVQREFAIDYNTIFLDENGYVEPGTFVSYTENTVMDKVYNIVVDGSRAAYVIDVPYANSPISGTVYLVEDGRVYLKDAFWQDPDTGQWRPVSIENNTVVVNYYENTVFGKNNAVVKAQALEIGDGVRVMAAALPEAITGGMEIDGYIVLVTR